MSKDSLEHGLEALEGMIKQMDKAGLGIQERLVVHDRTTEELSENVRSLKEKLSGMKVRLENIDETRKVVGKVTLKFNDIEKANRLLNKGSALDTVELLNTCDTLREAVRYARSLSKSQPSSRSYLREGEQQQLLDTAFNILQDRFRRIVTSEISSVDYATWQRNTPVNYIEPAKVILLEKIASRLTSAGITLHLDEFFSAAKKAITSSVTTCTEPVITLTEETSKDKRKKEFTTPGTHPCLDSLEFYKKAVSAGMDLGRQVFGDGWGGYLGRADPKDLAGFVGISQVFEMLSAVVGYFNKCRPVDQIYVYLDILRVFDDHWDGVFPTTAAFSSSHDTAPALAWSNKSDTLAKHAVMAITNYLRDLRNPTEPPPADGTVYEPLLVSANLLSRILQTYSENHFNFVVSRFQTEILTFRDFFEKLVTTSKAAVNSKAELLLTKRGNSLPTLFRLNNYQYLHKHLLELNTRWVNAEYCETLSQEVKSLTAEYLNISWGKIIACIPTDKDITNLTSDNKDWIKKHFKHFNEHLEARIKEEHYFNVPNVELKQSLLTCIAEYLVPHYRSFHGKYSRLPFSRTPERYIKYAPDGSRLLDASGQNVLGKLFAKQ